MYRPSSQTVSFASISCGFKWSWYTWATIVCIWSKAALLECWWIVSLKLIRTTEKCLIGSVCRVERRLKIVQWVSPMEKFDPERKQWAHYCLFWVFTRAFFFYEETSLFCQAAGIWVFALSCKRHPITHTHGSRKTHCVRARHFYSFPSPHPFYDWPRLLPSLSMITLIVDLLSRHRIHHWH